MKKRIYLVFLSVIIIVFLSGFIGGYLRNLPVFVLMLIFTAALAAVFIRLILKDINKLLRKISKGVPEPADEAENTDITAIDTGFQEADVILCKVDKLRSELLSLKKEKRSWSEKTSFILSSMNEGFVLINNDEKITILNSSAARIFDVPEDIEGQSILTLTRNSKILKAVGNVISKQRIIVFDIEAQGNIYSVHVSPVKGTYVGSKGVGATILLIDVTAQRESQKQRSEFFANASHELKTPITTVMGFSEMLVNGMYSDSDKQTIYKRIYRETRMINNLLNDILEISRIESGVKQLMLEDILLKTLTEDIIQSLSQLARECEVEVKLICEPNIVFHANSRHMQELIKNLLENAIKYNKPGGRAELKIERIGTSRLKITVEDTGIGIPQEAQARIFERFYRVDSSRNKSVGGTGLGLAIAKHIVLNMGGEINLQSKSDKGTKIVIKLKESKES